ncbi:hypothetical protein PYCCODRAFT_651163 [Trametes coccinea BRFM310]|uniref:Secreted protein n=1 Tax=Trametes coccinea (strain BRFM310) TaxID=1353009 RepID=A0A1Y2IL68_TRAC3|nr:hypothetical protein PYCCODRAFT_651163 [Trametes coccinea BRFM310]
MTVHPHILRRAGLERTMHCLLVVVTVKSVVALAVRNPRSSDTEGRGTRAILCDRVDFPVNDMVKNQHRMYYHSPSEGPTYHAGQSRYSIMTPNVNNVAYHCYCRRSVIPNFKLATCSGCQRGVIRPGRAGLVQ